MPTNPFMTAGTTSALTPSSALTDRDDLPEFKELAWDFDHNKFIYNRDGTHKVLIQNEAIKVWIRKALLVERYRYRAYFDDYGMELERFIGKTPNDGISQTLLFQYIKEGLLVNPYIKRVTAAGVTRTKKKIIMKLSVTTIYGKAEIETEV